MIVTSPSGNRATISTPPHRLDEAAQIADVHVGPLLQLGDRRLADLEPPNKPFSYTSRTLYSWRGPPAFVGERTVTDHHFPKTLPDGALDRAGDALPDIPFDPVPRLRQRRNGWSEERQRAFIAALTRCGSVAAAARAVGMTARSAYRLCDAAGADSFVAAWDQAIDIGISHLRADSLHRALEGGFVPVYRRGKLVRVEHRRNDKLAIALLGGQRASSDALRRSALSRREHRLDLFALDQARAEHKRQLAAADAAFRAEVDRLIATVVARGDYGPPRIRQL